MRHPSSTLRHAAVLAALAYGLATSAPAVVILDDDFDDDTIAQYPNGPEVGTYGPGIVGTHAVQSDGVDPYLQSSCSSPTGMVFRWFPSQTTLHRATVSYRFRIDSGSSLSAANAVYNDFALRRDDSFEETISLSWSNDLAWRHGGSVLGHFVLDTEYLVTWDVDLGADTYSLTINGVELVPPTAVGTGVQWFSELRVGCNTGTTAIVRVDDVHAIGDHLLVDGFESFSTSAWSSRSPAALVGDECDLPGFLGSGIEVYDSLSGFPEDATDDSSCGLDDRADHWFAWVTDCTGTATVSTCSAPTEFDTILAVYGDCSTASELACADDSTSTGPYDCDLDGVDRKSIATFPATRGESYRIRVSAWNDTFPSPSDMEFELRIDCAPSG